MKKYLLLLVSVLATAMSFTGLALKGDVPKVVSLLMFVTGLFIATAAFFGFFASRKTQTNVDTQQIITDLALLRLFEQQPGGLLSPKMVAEKTGLTKVEASSRLQSLSSGGLLRAGMSHNRLMHYYELAAPLEEATGIVLSDEPFLTLEDLQQIFVAYNYRVSPHDLMVTTGLPWRMLSLEMQHFRKAGIIEVANIARPGDSSKQYILVETYHPSGKLNLDSRNRINAEVKKVLYDENLLV